MRGFWPEQKVELRRICDQAQTEQPPSESLPLYVSVHFTPIRSDATFFARSAHVHPSRLVPLPFAGDDTFWIAFCIYLHRLMPGEPECVCMYIDHVFETNLSNYIDFGFSAFGCPQSAW